MNTYYICPTGEVQGPSDSLKPSTVGPRDVTDKRSALAKMLSQVGKAQGPIYGIHGPQHGMDIVLVEPDYYTRFPPLGLLKISTYHKRRGDRVKLVRVRTDGLWKPVKRPSRVYVTSLFTWSWRPVWKAVRLIRDSFPRRRSGLADCMHHYCLNMLPDQVQIPFMTV